MEGKYWKRRIETVVAEYKKWRGFFMDKVFVVLLGFFATSMVIQVQIFIFSGGLRQLNFFLF